MYYLFPTTAHTEPPATGGTTIPVYNATNTPGTVTLAVAHNRDNTIRGFNTTFSYQQLSDTELEAIALSPREFTTPVAVNLKQYPTTSTGNPWQLPSVMPNGGANETACDSYGELNYSAPASGSTPAQPNNMLRLVNLSGTTNRCVQVGFKDSAIFDGREMMSARLFNLDLNLMRNRIVSGLNVASGQQDTWLPTTGLVYAFREDAVREDGIIRPQLMAANNYANYDATPPTGVWIDSLGNPTGAGNIMNVWNNQDPPLINGISPKPVDYYPDPDRRSYGFRLRNGADLRREASGFTVPTKDVERGLSLISDNPVYVQGDFNLHTNGSATQEEFTEPLQANYSNFYTRPVSAINTNFARPTGDRWRQSEILADSITILSNAWTCDGTIQSGIRGDNVGCASGRSSFRNSNFTGGKPSNLNTTAAQANTTLIEALTRGFICENPFDPRIASFNSIQASSTQNSSGGNDNDRKGCDSPIKVFRNADIQYNTTTDGTLAYYSSFRLFSDKSAKESGLNIATPTTVNAVLVSGVVPTRPNGSNGGFHNFPRLLEDWNPGGTTQALSIAGSMLQLNFSNYATGPYDQDAWEPPNQPGTTDLFYYYRVPQRRWGYDVGLQITSAGPVARRLAEVPLSRSEFYREPPADDPYICKLRKVVETSLTCN